MENDKPAAIKPSSQLTRRIPVPDADLQFGKLPPQAVDIEEAVLGALMLERDALTDVIDILKPDSFYREGHKLIFEAIVQLFNNSEPVDIKTVVHQLRRNGKLEEAAESNGRSIAEKINFGNKYKKKM